MVSWDYYENTYLGMTVPRKAFPRYARQAQAILDRLCRLCRVEGGEDSKSMALCAMAETLYRQERYGGVESASAGEVSVRYRENRNLLSEVYTQAANYLDIYRGVPYGLSH